MTGDVGERLLNDPVDGPVHRSRHIVSLSFDRQRRIQADGTGPFHQFRDVVETTRRGRLVVAQRPQGRAQLPSRLTSGSLDRQQSLRHLFATPAGHVDGDFGLHLDDRDLMGERIVQLPRDVQPFLVGTAPRGLLTGALGLVRPPLGLPQRLTRGPGRDQPGDLQGTARLRERLARVVQARGQGSQGERGQHGHARHHGDAAVSLPYGRVHREQERDGGHIETGRLVPHRAQPGGGQDGNGSPAAPDERQAAGRQQRAAEQVEARTGVALGQAGDQQRRRHADGDRPVPHTGRDTGPSCAHARTLAGCGPGRVPLADECSATTDAVRARRLRRPRQREVSASAGRPEAGRADMLG